MKQKKVIALLAVAAMTVGLFSGCGSGSGDERNQGKGKITTLDANVCSDGCESDRRGILGRKNGMHSEKRIIVR